MSRSDEQLAGSTGPGCLEDDNNNNANDDVDVDDNKRLRRENAALKQLLRQAMHEKLKWADLPPDLQDSQEVVLEAIRCFAVSWHDLPLKWKNDVLVTRAALKVQDKKSFRYLLETDTKRVLWKHVPYHLMMDEELLIIALGADGGPQWKDVLLPSRNNPEIISAAFKNEKIRFEDIPISLRLHHRETAFLCVKKGLIAADECSCLDEDFLRKAIENGQLKWGQLPANLRNDPSFANSISCNIHNKYDTIRDILETIPVLRHDRPFWLRFDFPSLFQEFAPTELRADRDFLLELCCQKEHFFNLVSASLARDGDFLRKVLVKNAKVLQYLDHETQLLYPGLVENSIAALGIWERKNPAIIPGFHVAKAIHSSFWLKYDFVMEWIKAGLGVPKEVSMEIHGLWMSYREIALANVKFSERLCSFDFRYYVDQELRGDSDFMIEVLGHRPDLYTSAVDKAAADPWVLTVALGSAEFAKEYILDLHINGKDNEIDSIRIFLRSQLSAFDTFSRFILGNMLSTQSVEDTGTNLTMLNQGIETSLVLKKSLAGFVGIRTGKWPLLLRNAEKNLCGVISPWTSNA